MGCPDTLLATSLLKLMQTWTSAGIIAGNTRVTTDLIQWEADLLISDPARLQIQETELIPYDYFRVIRQLAFGWARMCDTIRMEGHQILIYDPRNEHIPDGMFISSSSTMVATIQPMYDMKRKESFIQIIVKFSLS